MDSTQKTYQRVPSGWLTGPDMDRVTYDCGQTRPRWYSYISQQQKAQQTSQTVDFWQNRWQMVAMFCKVGGSVALKGFLWKHHFSWQRYLNFASLRVLEVPNCRSRHRILATLGCAPPQNEYGWIERERDGGQWLSGSCLMLFPMIPMGVSKKPEISDLVW